MVTKLEQLIRMKDQKEAKISFLNNPWKIFFFESFLFCLTLGIGIVTAFEINEILRVEKIVLPPITFWQLLFNFIFITLVVLFIIFFKKFEKGKRPFFKAVFILAVFSGGTIVLRLWVFDLLALILIGLLIFWWLKKPLILIHNLAIVLGMAGLGAFLGLRLAPWLVVLFLVIFSIYDFIAVYKTKHMIKMAKEMIASEAILGLIIPQKISDFKAELKEIRTKGRFLILGGGDIVFPLLLCASLVSQGILESLIVAFFALIGLAFSFYIFISQKTRQPIPALPPIALFSIIGFLITKLL